MVVDRSAIETCLHKQNQFVGLANGVSIAERQTTMTQSKQKNRKLNTSTFLANVATNG